MSQTQLSFVPSATLLNTLTELDKAFKQTHESLQTYHERVRLAIHRFAKKGMLGWSANFADVLPTTDVKAAAQFAPLQQHMQDLLAADKRHATRHDPQVVTGYLQVLDHIYQNGASFLPLTTQIIQGLHGDLVHTKPGIPKGQYKKTVNSIKVVRHKDTDQEETIFRTVTAPGQETIAAMQELVAWYNGVRKNVPWTIAIACEFMLRFLRIHPFQDGNGRMARSLFLLVLRQSVHPFIANVAPYLGIYRHLDCHIEQYLNVMGEAAPNYCADPTQYHIEPLCTFMISVLHEALAAIPQYKQKLDAALQEQLGKMGIRI